MDLEAAHEAYRMDRIEDARRQIGLHPGFGPGVSASRAKKLILFLLQNSARGLAVLEKCKGEELLAIQEPTTLMSLLDMAVITGSRPAGAPKVHCLCMFCTSEKGCGTDDFLFPGINRSGAPPVPRSRCPCHA